MTRKTSTGYWNCSKSKYRSAAFRRVIWLFVLLPAVLRGQDPVPADTIRKVQNDTLGTTPVTTKPKYNFSRQLFKGPRHPKTAAYLGLMLPGAGQIYNKDYWKVPIVWGAYGGMGYLIYFNTTQYRRHRDALIMRLNNQPDEFQHTIPNTSALRNFRDAYRKDMELAYIGMVFVHLLSATEAFVAAHLKTFDVDENIGLRIGFVHDIDGVAYTHRQLPPVGLRFTWALR